MTLNNREMSFKKCMLPIVLLRLLIKVLITPKILKINLKIIACQILPLIAKGIQTFQTIPSSTKNRRFLKRASMLPKSHQVIFSKQKVNSDNKQMNIILLIQFSSTIHKIDSNFRKICEQIRLLTIGSAKISMHMVLLSNLKPKGTK